MSTSSSSQHSRHSSAASSDASTGASYGLILEHILAYPGTYEIPLRNMYALNCGPRTNYMRRPGSPSATASSGQNSQQEAAQLATAQFTTSLVNQIAQLPSQPCSLPPPFITNFVRRCFPAELAKVDFAQALTGLDYLKDLETRRRREIGKTFERLGVDKDALAKHGDDGLPRHHAALSSWLKRILSSEHQVELQYTQVYVSLRRWIIINEFSQTPFDKHNCHAMLNTLYPPLMVTQPTTQLTPQVLKRQREGFFTYIRAVEQKGPKTLDPLRQLGKKHMEDENGWPAAYHGLDSYLRIANALIDECIGILDLSYFDADEAAIDLKKRKERKADSGISFGSTLSRPATSHGDGNNSQEMPMSPSSPLQSPTQVPKSLSALERIAREVRRMKSTKRPKSQAGDAYSQYDKENPPPMPTRAADDTASIAASTVSKKARIRSSSLRKLRSLTDLRSANRGATLTGGHSRDGSEETFDVDEMKRQRMMYEAKTAREVSP